MLLKAILLSVLSIFLLLGSADASPNFSTSQAFREACQLSRYDCRGLKPPMVRYTRYVPGYGVYMGGRTIWLTKRVLTKEEVYVIKVHEMVHYLQDYRDEKPIPFTSKFQQCVQEQEAFEVSDIVAKRLGAKHMIRNGDISDYGC